MAGSNVPPTLIRGTNNTGNASLNAGVTPSRLLLNTNSLRNDLQTRNLYTPNNLYPTTAKSQAQNIVNAVNGIASIIAPFKAFNLENTVYGRLIVEQTPLTVIGLSMLGKQFALNAASHISQQNLPVIKLGNLFDGVKETKLFTKNINLKITTKDNLTNFQQFLNAVVDYQPANDNPFKNPKTTNVNSIPIDSNPTIQNQFYIQKTGTGQISFLLKAFNQNMYKEGFGSTPTDKALQQAATDSDTKFYPKDNLVGTYSFPKNKYKRYYDFFNTNPYSNIHINGNDPFGIVDSQAVQAAITPASATSPTQEYAPSKDFVDLNFGITNTNNTGSDAQLDSSENTWIKEADEFGDELQNKIVWGRDSVNFNYNAEEQGTFANIAQNINTSNNLRTKFHVYSGLLEYTRGLVNASQGVIADQTRKAFADGQNVAGFNGSALWVVNGGIYAGDNNGKTGCVSIQH